MKNQRKIKLFKKEFIELLDKHKIKIIESINYDGADNFDSFDYDICLEGEIYYHENFLKILSSIAKNDLEENKINLDTSITDFLSLAKGLSKKEHDAIIKSGAKTLDEFLSIGKRNFLKQTTMNTFVKIKIKLEELGFYFAEDE